MPEVYRHGQIDKWYEGKINISSKQEQVQILTITPESWSIRRTCQEFKVSENCGVKRDYLLNQMPKKGQKIPQNVKDMKYLKYTN